MISKILLNYLKKRFPRYFKLLQKPGTRGPRNSLKLLQIQSIVVHEIFSNYFKYLLKTRDHQDSFRPLIKRIPEVLQTTSKTRYKGFPKLFETIYFKNQYKDSPRFFQTASKTKYKNSPRVFQTTSSIY